jgi:transposase
MKLYGGIDLHSNNTVVALLDEEDRVVLRARLANEAVGVLAALAPYREAIVGLVVESTDNWYWLVDALMDAGYRVHLANTAAIVQYSGLKYSDDDSDARWLAKLLRLGLLPEGYIYPKEDRAVRDLLRRRMRLVQHGDPIPRDPIPSVTPSLRLERLVSPLFIIISLNYEQLTFQGVTNRLKLT